MAYVRDFAESRPLTSSARMTPTCGHNTSSEQAKVFWHNTYRFSPRNTIREELEVGRFYLILSGWVAEVADIEENRRQIICFHLPGDLIRRSSENSKRNFIALTKLDLGDVEILRDRGDTYWRQKINQAQSRLEEQLFNHLLRIGRLTAAERLLHLLLELHDRLESAGLVKGPSYRIPVTQQMLGDALGFSLVHIHRTLQELRHRKLLTFRRGLVTLHDPGRLAVMACYEPCGPERPSSPLTEGRGERARSVDWGAGASAVA